MEQSGEYDIPASRSEVWAALNDPEVLGRCITGCQNVEQIDERHFDVKVKAKIGPVSATFQAALELDDLHPPESYTIKGGVKGGAAGFGKGDARVSLAEIDDANTRLTYQVNGSVGGKLAQVGSRLVDGAARKMADEFFAAFRDHLASDASGGSNGGEETAGGALADVESSSQSAAVEAKESPVSEPASENAPAASEPRYEKSGSNLIWIIAFVVLGLAILFAA